MEKNDQMEKNGYFAERFLLTDFMGKIIMAVIRR